MGQIRPKRRLSKVFWFLTSKPGVMVDWTTGHMENIRGLRGTYEDQDFIMVVRPRYFGSFYFQPLGAFQVLGVSM